MGDYMRAGFRQAGAITIAEHRTSLMEAYRQGQRDAEQGWTADVSRWWSSGPCSVSLSASYHAGYVNPRHAEISEDERQQACELLDVLPKHRGGW